MGKADTITYKHLAHLLSEKWSSPYSVVMGRLRCSLGFSLLHPSVMCIRGSRSRSKHPCMPPAVDLAVAEDMHLITRPYVNRLIVPLMPHCLVQYINEIIRLYKYVTELTSYNKPASLHCRDDVP